MEAVRTTKKWRQPQNEEDLKMKTTSKWRRPQDEDNLKNEDNLRNEDDLRNENDLKNEDDLKHEDYLKHKDDLKKEDDFQKDDNIIIKHRTWPEGGGVSVRDDFPLKTKQKKHGLKTLDFAYRSFRDTLIFFYFWVVVCQTFKAL